MYCFYCFIICLFIFIVDYYGRGGLIIMDLFDNLFLFDINILLTIFNIIVIFYNINIIGFYIEFFNIINLIIWVNL